MIESVGLSKYYGRFTAVENLSFTIAKGEVVAFLGPAVAGLISGSFVVETIFQIPGLGRHFVEAAFNRDYTMVIGTVLFYAALIILMNLLVDILQAWLNPRTRLES